MSIFVSGSSHRRIIGAAFVLAVASLILLVTFAESIAQAYDDHCEDGCDSNCECDLCFTLSPMMADGILVDAIPIPLHAWSGRLETDLCEQVWFSGIDHPPQKFH
ncbi:MAG: hypothetical protein ABIK83_11620 [Candidatus Zixiibacteriota bacterium]